MKIHSTKDKKKKKLRILWWNSQTSKIMWPKKQRNTLKKLFLAGKDTKTCVCICAQFSHSSTCTANQTNVNNRIVHLYRHCIQQRGDKNKWHNQWLLLGLTFTDYCEALFYLVVYLSLRWYYKIINREILAHQSHLNPIRQKPGRGSKPHFKRLQAALIYTGGIQKMLCLVTCWSL